MISFSDSQSYNILSNYHHNKPEKSEGHAKISMVLTYIHFMYPIRIQPFRVCGGKVSRHGYWSCR